MVILGDPTTVTEAIEWADHTFWEEAIINEMKALEDNETWLGWLTGRQAIYSIQMGFQN